MRDEGAAPVGAGDGRRAHVPPGLDWLAAMSWRVLLILVTAGVLLLTLARLRLVVLPLIIGLLVTAVLLPPVRWLRDRGLRPMAATWLVLFGCIATFGIFLALAAPQVIREFEDLGPTLSEAVDSIEDWLVEGPVGLSAEDLERHRQSLNDQLSERSGDIVGGVASGAAIAIELIAGLILAFVVTFFFLKDGDRIQLWALDLLDERRAGVARRLARRGWTAVSGYIRGTAAVALIDAIGIGLGLLVIGVPLVLPLAVLTFFGGFFPIVGATSAGVVAVLVALVTGGVRDAVLVTIVVIGVQQLESNVLAPVVLGRAVRLHPLVILIALTTGGVTGGIIGAFLAVPVAAVAAAMLGEYRDIRREEDGAAGAAAVPGPPGPGGVEDEIPDAGLGDAAT